ncbi:MAG: hypothetical protein A2Z34_06850 [Planctomycetes bacterium RBG_16_59_8]|nr:MAG: hypothetical protein A2Z34_06850 [Planctomycetes bacterium RBG_16_59_8]
MTPIGRSATVADLAVDLGLPLIVVARPALGTLNHTLLTLHYARCRGLDIRAVIVNHAAGHSPDPSEKTNAADLRRLCGVPLVAEIPHLGGDPIHTLSHPAFDRITRFLFPARR